MAIKFEELRKYVARNVRLSICFEDGYYHDYLMMSDIPEQKYAGFYIYGVGMVDVEFSRDVYMALPEPEACSVPPVFCCGVSVLSMFSASSRACWAASLFCHCRSLVEI